MKHHQNTLLELILKISFPIISFTLISWIFTDHFFVFTIDPFRQWVSGGILFFIIPFFLYHSINIWGKSESIHMMAISMAALSVLIIGPTWALTSDSLELSIYKKNGIHSKGIVVANWTEKSNIEKSIKYKFTVSDKEYLSFNEHNPDNKYSIGDSVQIVYNRNNPEMNCLKEKLELLNK